VKKAGITRKGGRGGGDWRGGKGTYEEDETRRMTAWARGRGGGGGR